MSGILGALRGRPRPPQDPPVTPPRPEARIFGATIGQTRGKTLKAFLVPDYHTPIDGVWVSPSRVEFVVPAAIREGVDIHVWAEGIPQTLTIVRASFGGIRVDSLGALPWGDAELDGFDLDWSRVRVAPGAWSIDGQYCRDAATSALVTEISASGFASFPDFARGGENGARPYLEYLHSLGFNTIRTFLGYWGGLGQFDPRQHIDKLPDYWQLAADCGLRVHQTVFADTPAWCPDPNEQLHLFMRVYGLAQQGKSWVRIEGGNELDDARNRALGLDGADLAVVIKANGLLASHGSTIQDGGYLQPVWRTADYHPARGGEDWPRRCGHNAWEDVAAKTGAPTFASEIKRPDEAGYKPWQFYEAGANIAQQCAGGTFHSSEGKAAAIFSGPTELCARAFIQGMNDVPLEFRTGHYTAGHLSDSPVAWKQEWSGRAHAKVLSGRALVVLAGMPRVEAERVEPRGGWGVVERRGPHGQVMLLAR